MSEDQIALTKPDETKPEPAKEPEPTREERVAALLKGYELGLAHNAPRTQAELNELTDLLS